MAFDVSAVRTRKAGPKDFHDVMEISRNVFYGFDYLPALYMYFNHHPDIHIFVVELKGKVIGFGGVWIIEPNEEVPYICGFGGRLAPQYQGKGITRIMMSNLSKFLSTKLPQGFYEVSSSYYQPNIHEPTGANWNPRNEISLVWRRFAYKASVNRVQHNLASIDNKSEQTVRAFDTQRTAELLCDERILTMLKQDGDFIPTGTNILPMKVTKRNILNLAKRCSLVLFTMSEEGKLYNGVSFCESCKCNKNILMSMYCFGDVTTESIKDNVCYYLRHTLNHTANDLTEIRLWLHMPLALDTSALEAALEPILGHRESSNIYQTTKALLVSSREKLTPEFIAKL